MILTRPFVIVIFYRWFSQHIAELQVCCPTSGHYVQPDDGFGIKSKHVEMFCEHGSVKVMLVSVPVMQCVGTPGAK
jgi:hypothetical protein